jgi:hypothetical protein
MKPSEEYQQLIDAGLIVPARTMPSRFKYPTMLVSVPNVTTNTTTDKNRLGRIIDLDAQLERITK